MFCLDDCHNYVMDSFMEELVQSQRELRFYEMKPDGTKRDGTTNEEVIRVLIHRLNFLNDKWMDGKFRCRENSIAITKLEEALMWLDKRTANRLARKVEGTQEK